MQKEPLAFRKHGARWVKNRGDSDSFKKIIEIIRNWGQSFTQFLFRGDQAPLPPTRRWWRPSIGPHRACLDGEQDGELRRPSPPTRQTRRWDRA